MPRITGGIDRSYHITGLFQHTYLGFAWLSLSHAFVIMRGSVGLSKKLIKVAVHGVMNFFF